MTNTKIGAFIATLRKEQGMTQEQLAEKLGVSNRSVSRWENGNTLPDFSLMQVLAPVLNVDLSELLSGQRLPKDNKTEDCIRLALELSQREQRTLRQSLNRCFGFGLALILCATLFHRFTEAPQIFFLLCCGCGIALIIAGFWINNRNTAAIAGSVITADDTRLRMTTANELLHFSMKYQTGHKKQHRRAFEALAAALDNAEFAQFSFIADSCTINGSPGPWHIAVAVTNKRLLFCGEAMRGALLPVYPVKYYSREAVAAPQMRGDRLLLQLDDGVIEMTGNNFKSIFDRLRRLFIET